jgi:hypothetical protein
MSRNGSGVYSLPAGNPVVTATTISSTWANNTLTDIANALTGSLSADGQTLLTGNLNVNNNNLTNVSTITSVTSNNTGTATTVNLVSTGTVTGGTGVVNYGSGQFYKDASGNIGIGTTTPGYKLDVNGNASFGSLITTGTGVSTGAANIELGGNRTGNGVAFIDFHATSGSDFETRIIRDAGTNGDLTIANNGTGEYKLISVNTGPLGFYTNSARKMGLDSQGQFTVGNTGNAIVSSADSYIQSVSNSPVGQYVAGQTSSLWWSFGRDSVSTGYFVFAPLGTVVSYINTTTGVYTAVSDKRLKKNITPLQYGLKEVLQLNPVMYNMKTEADTKKKHIGLIAQEVKVVMDELVEDIDETKQNYGLSATELVPVLIKAIQELNARIVVLENKK